MSDTGFKAPNKWDLIRIFKPYTSGSKAPTTYFKDPSGNDLSDIFEPYDGISTKSPQTYFKSNGQDLNNIFQFIYNFQQITYNPFSGSTATTGYTYNIFSVGTSLTINTSISNAYIFMIGGGGGGGAGLGYEGGGAGGSVCTIGPITLQSGTYTVVIGEGGIGGQFESGNPGNNGNPGQSTTISGPNNFNYTAGGGGGGGSNGSRGTNSNSGNAGWGGQNDITVTNVQGTGNGFGCDGYAYTFQDSTGTIFNFGGGGGSGGRNSQAVTPGIFYGGGGTTTAPFVPTTGGCGGTGYGGINTGNAYDYIFNGYTYATGSGGGGGGNSSAYYYSDGGNGCNGLVIVYYLTP